ncbi:MAG: hypothetical protein V1838_05240 [Patescibacteria group bacterium]
MISNFEKKDRAGHEDWQAPVEEMLSGIPREKDLGTGKNIFERLKKSDIGKKIKRATAYTMATMILAGAIEIGRKYNMAQKDIKEIKREKPADLEDAKRFEDNIKYLESIFGNSITDKIAKNHQIENRENNNDYPKIAGAKKNGFKEEQLKAMWQEGATYPEGWIKGEIRKISLHEHIPFVKIQGKADKKYYGRLDEGYGGGEKDVNIYGVQEGTPEFRAFTADIIFSHELSHANDWETDKDLTYTQRLALLANVQRQIEKGNNYDDLGWSKDEINIDDNKQRDYVYAREMWAEWCQEYFTFPREFKKNYPEEYELVHQLVTSQDPNFNSEEAVLQRYLRIDEAQSSINESVNK